LKKSAGFAEMSFTFADPATAGRSIVLIFADGKDTGISEEGHRKNTARLRRAN
jgi:hypothetical protein